MSVPNARPELREVNGRGDKSLPEINSMGKEEVKKLLDSVDTVIFDCDGVLWLIDRVFPESSHVVSLLKKMGKRVFFITNNSLHLMEDVVKRLQTGGIPATEEDIIFPAVALSRRLERLGFKDKIEILGSHSLKRQIRLSGFNVVDEQKANRLVDKETQFFEEISVDDDIKAVAVDIDLNCNYMKVTRLLALLQNPECLYFSLAPDKKIPLTSTFSTAGPHFLLDLIKELTGREPYVLGKPSTEMFDLLKEKYTIDVEKTLFIGDSIETDIALGRKVGVKTMLVFSGTSNPGKIDFHDEKKRPHYLANHISDLLPYLQPEKSP